MSFFSVECLELKTLYFDTYQEAKKAIKTINYNASISKYITIQGNIKHIKVMGFKNANDVYRSVCG